MPTTLKWAQGFPAPPERAKQEDLTLVTGHLVGRADELGSLERILDELDRGHPGAIELVGEPGIGKTRLLKELAARAEARGHLVLWGAASELERGLPFCVFLDALDEYVAGLEPERLAVLDDHVQAELAQVFPSLPALADGRGVALQHERYRSHRAVREVLVRLAAPTPWCSCWMTSTGPTPRPSSYWARYCADRRLQRS